MQHKHHSYKYVLYVYVSCASSRWNWPNRNVVQHQAEFKNNSRLKCSFVVLVIQSLVWNIILIIVVISHLLQARMLTFMIWCKLNFFFHLLFVFSACSANMMYSVSCCSLFLLVLPLRAPRKDVSCLRAGHLLRKAPVGKTSDGHSLKP